MAAAQITSFFQTPGANLQPSDKIIFDEIKVIVDRATDPLLLRTDWESNIRCSDLVNQQLSSEILAQVVFLLRRKLTSRQPKQVYLTIALVESLVKNCGTRLHAAVNNEAFTAEMCRVARKFVRLSGPDNLEVSEACLDVLQAWGEAFLPRQRQFPNLVKAYQDLRVEGLPFRKQYDPSRVPIFTPAGPGGDETDIILAAAIASAAVQDEREAAGGGGGQRGSDDLRASLSGTVFEPLCNSIALLRDMLLQASSAQEVRGNDLVPELSAQVEELQKRLMGEIEEGLGSGSESVDVLFKLNDDSQLVLAAVKDIGAGAELAQVLAALGGLSSLNAAGGSAVEAGQARASGASGGGLLDFGEEPFGAPGGVAIRPAAAPQPHALPAPASAPRALPLTPPPTAAATATQTDPFLPLPAKAAPAASSASAAASAPFDPFGPSTSIDDILLSGPPSASSTQPPKAMSAIDELLSMSSSGSSGAPMTSGWGAAPALSPVDSIPTGIPYSPPTPVMHQQMQQQQQMYFNQLPSGWPAANVRNSIGGRQRGSFTGGTAPGLAAPAPAPQAQPQQQQQDAKANPFDVFQ